MYVDCDPAATYHWKTRSAEQATVNWAWPDSAARAVLRVCTGATTNDVALTTETSSWTWTQPSAAASVASMTLTFYTSDGQALADETLVADGLGAFSESAASVVTADAAFTHVTGTSAVLPIPAGASTLEINGASQTLAGEDCPSWFDWSGLQPGQTYVLHLQGGGMDDEVSLRALASGMMFLVR